MHLELGGKNAIIVMDDADVDLAVDGILWSAFGTTGQRCTAASRVIVHEAVYDALQGKLVARAEAMRLGPGWEPSTDVGPVINRAALDKIHAYTGVGQRRGRAPAHRRRGRDRARGSSAASSTARRCSATSSRGCGSRRRRSSARRRR